MLSKPARLLRLTVTLLLFGSVIPAQQVGRLPRVPLPENSTVVNSVEGQLRVVVFTKGLSHPWSLAFLPDGRMLVTERSGQVRIIRDGVLDPKPIPGTPKVHAVRLSGLMDIALHPNFAQNQIVYLTYTKNVKAEPLEVATTLARRRPGARAVDVGGAGYRSWCDGRAAAADSPRRRVVCPAASWPSQRCGDGTPRSARGDACRNLRLRSVGTRRRVGRALGRGSTTR